MKDFIKFWVAFWLAGAIVHTAIGLVTLLFIGLLFFFLFVVVPIVNLYH